MSFLFNSSLCNSRIRICGQGAGRAGSPERCHHPSDQADARRLVAGHSEVLRRHGNVSGQLCPRAGVRNQQQWQRNFWQWGPHRRANSCATEVRPFSRLLKIASFKFTFHPSKIQGQIRDIESPLQSHLQLHTSQRRRTDARRG